MSKSGLGSSAGKTNKGWPAVIDFPTAQISHQDKVDVNAPIDSLTYLSRAAKADILIIANVC